jgi:protein-histidine pros-kinase
LLVDGSPLIRKATSRSLIREGHHVEVAQHGADCLKVLAAADIESDSGLEYGFDLILMDLQMPVMDGIEATNRIRALEKQEMAANRASGRGNSRRIVIIGVTANAEVEAREDCIEAGMDGFMEKPLKVLDLLDCIETITAGNEKKDYCDEV